jgi:type VI secretion system protein ImpH
VAGAHRGSGAGVSTPTPEPAAGAPADRRAEAEALLARLEAEPWSFHLFRAMRLLEARYADQPRLGRAQRLRDEPVRFGQEPSLSFAPATLASFRRGADGPARLDTFVLGVFGPNGPLPLHLTEYARGRERSFHDPTFRRFADLFHHRMVELFYRAWAAAQPVAQADRPDDDRFAFRVGALAGFATDAGRGRGVLPDAVRLHWAGLFALPARPAEGLERLLAGYFDLPVRIEPCVGHWIHVPADSLARLGGGECGLGTSATLGERVWDCAGKFRVVIGPVGHEAFERMLPGRESLARLTELVRTWTNDELWWDVRVVLKREEVPGTRLDGRSALGWNTWALAGPARQDAQDYVIDPMSRMH